MRVQMKNKLTYEALIKVDILRTKQQFNGSHHYY